MEILINELSLERQFADVEHFINDALIPFISILKEFDTSKDMLLKKQDFWDIKITTSQNLHYVLTQKSDEATRFKSAISSLISEPFWESSQKHNTADVYEYNKKNLFGTSLAESCERDKIVISFIHSNYSKPKLEVIKNHNSIVIDNLCVKEHYIEIAYNRGQIDKSKYFERKLAFGKIALLDDESQFENTGKISKQGTPVYKDRAKRYWHLDNIHNHYEVYNREKKHIGVADMQGKIDYSRKVNGRNLI
jgi:hypothetical protein